MSSIPFFQLCQLSGAFVIKISIVFLVLEMSHSNSTYVLPQISRTSHVLMGNWRQHLHYAILTNCDNECLCFLRRTGSNLSASCEGCIFVPSLEIRLGHKKAYGLCCCCDEHKTLLVNSQMRDPLN